MSDTNDAAHDAHERLVASEADPDTTLEGAPFVTDDVSAKHTPSSLAGLSHAELTGEAESSLRTIDVFAVVAEYDHEVGKQTAPEYDSYEEAREAGVTLLATNGNVLSFRIDKRTTRKA